MILKKKKKKFFNLFYIFCLPNRVLVSGVDGYIFVDLQQYNLDFLVFIL